jgi:phage-related baseplate assembly protein
MNLQMKPESYSTAGPTEGYKFHARSASGLIKDVNVSSPEPGTTLVTVLSSEGKGIPSKTILDLVTSALNADRVRPLCEKVIIQQAEIIYYAIIADLYVYAGAVSPLITNEAESALVSYANTHHKLGEDITVSAVNAAAFIAGVQRVVLNLNADLTVAHNQAAWCSSILVRIAGVVP